ncbi:LysR family transcriptional regulator [Alicyclobacillus fastidiosus]|uniref:LysR family transcriptional regulator n=1 Tax=Alicyclobacillus fastidiosus TaxID=392011 RepID=A0ABV5A918_9BACL|nr:LysR family transcriptional regulator [Alicyclobacillus fastidiosus]WEH10711.1 LysR family transcriptional regulator [Alicyclobacillus fastidiosus]
MSEHLSLHQLELFRSVVDHGSYVEAAKELMITQPALSLQVKSLQNFLSTALFERKGNHLYLTDTGRIAYEFAQDILALEQKLITTVDELMQHDQGNLAIGSNRPFGRYFLPHIIAQYMGKLDEIQISVVYKDTETIYNQVLNKILDVGVVTSDETVPLPSGLRATMLRHDHWCLVCSSQSPWAQHVEIARHLFQSIPLISAVTHSTHWKLIQQILRNLGISDEDYTIRLRMEDLESIKIVVLEGLGMAFLPYTSVRQELANGQLVEFSFPDLRHPPLDCVIVTQNNLALRPTVQRFVDFLVASFPRTD